MEKILTILEFIFCFLTDAMGTLVDVMRKNKPENAKFGREGLIASRFNKGFLISKHRRLSTKASFQNLSINGQTGSGKTVRLLVKNLFELKNCSLIINDPIGELLKTAGPYLSNYFDLKVLNNSKPEISSAYNYLSRIKTETDVYRLSHILTSASFNKGNSNDPFWGLQTESMLSVKIRLIMHQRPEYRNLYNVLHLVKLFSANPKAVDELIVKTHDEKLILDYKAILKYPEKTLMNIVATTLSALKIFEIESVAKTTSYDSINLDELRKRPTALFLQTSVADQRFLSVLTSIFFEQVFSHFLNHLPSREDLNTFLILEEASSLHCPLLPLALANLRKHRVGTILSLQQGSSQLKKLYGDDADNILANTVTRVYLPGSTDTNLLKEIEYLSGKTIIKDKKSEKVKPLISASEIRQLADNRAIIISGNKPIILGRTSPYYKSWKYKRRASLPEIQFLSDIPQGKIPLIGEQ